MGSGSNLFSFITRACAFAVALVSFTGSAWANPCQDALNNQDFTVQQHFLTATVNKELISQTDLRLYLRGLLVPNGGLCTTTCATNILISAAKYLGRDPGPLKSDPAYVIHKLVHEVWNRSKIDARYGLDFEHLIQPLQDVAQELGIHTSPILYRSNSTIGFPEFYLSSMPNTFTMISVRSSVGGTLSRDQFHALVVLKVDPDLKTIYYSDPNSPHVVFKSTYEVTIDKSNYSILKLNIDNYSKHKYAGTVLEILHIPFFRMGR